MFHATTFTVEVKNVAATDTVSASFASLGFFPTVSSNGVKGPNGGYLFTVTLASGTVVPPPAFDFFVTAHRAADNSTSTPFYKTVTVDEQELGSGMLTVGQPARAPGRRLGHDADRAARHDDPHGRDRCRGVGGSLSAMQDQRKAQSRLDAVTATQRSLERVTKDLRAADPLVAADARSVTTLVYHGTCAASSAATTWTRPTSWSRRSRSTPRRRRARTGPARWARRPAASSSRASSTPAREPVFVYQRIDPAQSALVPVTTPVASTLVSLVDSVTINVKAGLKYGQQPVVVQTAVDLRNVERNS